MGVGVAITDPLATPNGDPFEIPRRDQEERVPYDDELNDLLIEKESLTLSQLKEISALHDRCKAYRHGRIPISLRERVDAMLERYR